MAYHKQTTANHGTNGAPGTAGGANFAELFDNQNGERQRETESNHTKKRFPFQPIGGAKKKVND